MADRCETFERELTPEPGRTALVVVDMQRGFLDPGEATKVPRRGTPWRPSRSAVSIRSIGRQSPGASLDEALRARNVTSLVVAGTMTDICVLATVIGAFHRENRVTVVEDGVSTLWPETQRATLNVIGRAYGRIATAKEVVDQISTWSH